jgi:hypothetical protein
MSHVQNLKDAESIFADAIQSQIHQEVARAIEESEQRILTSVLQRFSLLETKLTSIFSEVRYDFATQVHTHTDQQRSASSTSKKNDTSVKRSMVPKNNAKKNIVVGNIKDVIVKRIMDNAKKEKQDKSSVFFNYDMIRGYSAYERLISSGFLDITTNRQKLNGTIAVYHPINQNVFYTIFSDGVVRENQLKSGTIKKGNNLYSNGNKIHPGKEANYRNIKNPSNRFRAMASYIIRELA